MNQEQYEAIVLRVQGKEIVLKVQEGRLKGKTIIVDSSTIQTVNKKEYKAGDEVIVTPVTLVGKESFFIVDYSRTNSLYWLFFAFVFLVVIIARKKGFMAIVGMIISFFVIFQFVLPQILHGADPIVTTILASLVIIPVNFYLSHGFNKKTSIAIGATFLALVITGMLAIIFVNVGKLSGFASEEATYLETVKQGALNLKGLLLAGIIIGLLGILDDITVAQTGVVKQLKEVSSGISFKELYKRGMEIGRDHIASLVNTLILVYAGAAMPLLLLFLNNPLPFSKVINQEMVAEELVRTIIASCGLILAVPITTLLACYFYGKNK